MDKTTNILLYGFSRYAHIKENTSEEIINKIQMFAKPQEVKINTKVFEVSYSKLEDSLRNALTENSYDIIIGFGLCPGCTGLRLEKMAFNMIDSPHLDIEGCRLQNKHIVDNGADTIDSNLNLEKIRECLLGANIPSYISNKKDLYICNYAFYLTANHAIKFWKEARYGFVHFPLTCKQVCNQKKQIASLPLDLMVRGTIIIIEEALKQFSEN